MSAPGVALSAFGEQMFLSVPDFGAISDFMSLTVSNNEIHKKALFCAFNDQKNRAQRHHQVPLRLPHMRHCRRRQVFQDLILSDK
jgi:hypothetical protein